MGDFGNLLIVVAAITTVGLAGLVLIKSEKNRATNVGPPQKNIQALHYLDEAFAFPEGFKKTGQTSKGTKPKSILKGYLVESEFVIMVMSREGDAPEYGTLSKDDRSRIGISLSQMHNLSTMAERRTFFNEWANQLKLMFLGGSFIPQDTGLTGENIGL